MTEKAIARWIHSGGVPMDSFNEISTDLEFFLTELLIAVYPEWKQDSLDGIELTHCLVTDQNNCSMLGLVWLIRDQKTVPMLMEIKTDWSGEKILWCECRIGESGSEGMLRMDYPRLIKKLYSIVDAKNSINWAYHLAYGDR
ncbi:hypothetical protein Pla110_33640 [Polystyrenella longa]|uniref:Uncharacterized protein n=1 Tax=Polystyrenella longa TaxID=2528007 RepID=A0A518CQW4_9PLAN|nr:hypothetical protein [Polystyrenella longa]QDU81621.1 hypothetical protein Pla110_33640 [Polystyrenella longa]